MTQCCPLQSFHLLGKFRRPFPTSVCLPVKIGKEEEVKAAVAQNDPTVNLNVISLYSKYGPNKLSAPPWDSCTL